MFCQGGFKSSPDFFFPFVNFFFLSSLEMIPKTSPLFLDLSSYLTKRHREQEFREFFGLPSYVCELLWRWCSPHTPHKWFWSPDKLFGCLYFLKQCPNAGTISSMFDCDWRTFEKDLWNSLNAINETLPSVCVFVFFTYTYHFLSFHHILLYFSLTSLNDIQIGHTSDLQ